MKKYIIIVFALIISFVSYAKTSHPVVIGCKVIKGIRGHIVSFYFVSDSTGNFYVVGNFYGTVDFDPGPGVYNLAAGDYEDIFILKLDSLGQFLWAKSIANTSSPSVALDKYGNVYITGIFSRLTDFNPGPGVFNLSAKSYDNFLLKLNTHGYFAWAKSFRSISSPFHSESPPGASICIDNSGNVIIAGRFDGVVDFDPGVNNCIIRANGSTDVFIVKLSNSGDFIWANRFGGALSDIGYSVDTDYFGNIYVTGNFGGTIEFETLSGTNSIISNGMWDIFIVKLDPDGNFVWARNKGKKWRDNGRSIAVSPTGDVYIAGVLESEIIVWNKYTNSYTGIPNSPNMYIAKLDSTGNFIWENSIVGSGTDKCNSISLDNEGNVYATGSFRDTINFGANSIIPELVASDSRPLSFLIKYNSNGQVTWAKKSIGSGYSIFIDKNNSLFLSGKYRGSLDFNIGADSTFNNNNRFMTKISQSTISNNNIYKQDTTVQIHPNPTWNSIKIELPDTLSGNIELYNMVGKKVLEKDFTNQQIIDVNIEKLHDSEYVLKIYNTSVIIALKTIIKN